jgi:hypothetical protein
MQQPGASGNAHPRSDRAAYVGSGTVLEPAADEPQFCLGGVMDSLPPQCDGIPLKNWDWRAVDDEERAMGTRWGSYELTGIYDGSTFTVTGPVRPPQYSDPSPEITTPCSEPDEGWEPGGTQHDVQAASHIARRAPDFAGLWVDHLGDSPDEFSPVILNVAFTGDTTRHEAELHQEWSGPLCVVRFERTLEELREIQSELHLVATKLDLEILWSDANEYTNKVQIGVVVIHERTRSDLDSRYGKDTIEVFPALEPASRLTICARNASAAFISSLAPSGGRRDAAFVPSKSSDRSGS